MAKSKKVVKEEAPAPVIKGSVKALPHDVAELPRKGTIKRYIITCAQNNTPLFDAAWDSLKTLASYYEASILISRFVYEHTASQQKASKPGSRDTSKEPWYDPRIEEYVADRRILLAPGLMFCGELNILPTAVRPLSGLESYTGRASSIIPHVKIAMESVASGKSEATKLMYTTGTVTQRNYIQRKAGQKAQFHHGYGALLVEVNHEGSWWCRQLNSDSDGVIYDLNVMVDGLTLAEGVRAEAVSWGDVHVAQIDAANSKACWGVGGIFETLRPKHQFFHDILDFRSRNHHDRGNAHKSFERFVNGTGNVLRELIAVEQFLQDNDRKWCCTVVVDSNHDDAMEKWLVETDFRQDPENAIFYLEAQLAKYKAIEQRDKNFHLFEWSQHKLGLPRGIKFLRPDESFVICHDANGGIECGMHGHNGPNGRRGSPIAFARMGRKAVGGHAHSAGIWDGYYQAGTSSKLDLGYNVGPSSWTHSHVVTYPNGKRAILTVWKGKPWA